MKGGEGGSGKQEGTKKASVLLRVASPNDSSRKGDKGDFKLCSD